MVKQLEMAETCGISALKPKKHAGSWNLLGGSRSALPVGPFAGGKFPILLRAARARQVPADGGTGGAARCLHPATSPLWTLSTGDMPCTAAVLLKPSRVCGGGRCLTFGFNFVQLERSRGEGKLYSAGIYNPRLFVESALKWYCCAVLARDYTRWPLRAQLSTRIIPYKRFALNVMKQMTKSINLEWCGYHKNDVNSEFTVVMKLFRIIIKTSTFFFLSE